MHTVDYSNHPFITDLAVSKFNPFHIESLRDSEHFGQHPKPGTKVFKEMEATESDSEQKIPGGPGRRC